MLRKKEAYTIITPIPKHIPRQLALDILHSHEEIISLSPLVTEIHPTKTPRDAPTDEYYSTWYEITERIQYIPGFGKAGSGTITFKGCFHDMPWGLQTHIYAPLSIDMRTKFRIGGNQPGEPAERAELGVGVPTEGLYLREDIEIRANITLVSYVKAQLKASSKILVDRLIKKAELLDSGALLAMMEDGKLKTINPANLPQTTTQPPSSPGMAYQSLNPNMQPPSSPGMPYKSLSPNMQPAYPYAPSPSAQAYNQNRYSQQSIQSSQPAYGIELPGDTYYQDPGKSPSQGYLHPQYSPHPSHISPHSDHSGGSPQVNQNRWSEHYQSQSGSRPQSYASDVGPMRSPMLDQKAMGRSPVELPTTTEDHEDREIPPPPYRGNDKAAAERTGVEKS